MFKCKFLGAESLVLDELRKYYSLVYVYWVKVFIMEVSMSIGGCCIYAVCIFVPTNNTETSR